MRTLLALPLALILLVAPATAQEQKDIGTEYKVTLLNGDVLTGILIDVTDTTITIDHPVLGEIPIQRLLIQPPPPPEPEATGPESPWSGSFDLSLSGSDGNSVNQSFRTGLSARHEGERAVDTYSITYRRSEENRTATEDKAFATARREWLLEDSLWRPFLQGTLERDRFTDWDYRLGLHTGAAYPIQDDEEEKLTGRLGVGASREFGGTDDSWTPEGLLGLDYWLAINDTTRLTAGVDVFPNLEDMGEFRTVSRAQYETELFPDDPWTLKAGIEHFYDSTPEGAKPQDVNYYVGLGYTF